MLKNHYARGARAALERFKLSNLAAGAQAYNPTLNGQTPTPNMNPTTAPPTSAAPPLAAGAPKAKVLG